MSWSFFQELDEEDGNDKKKELIKKIDAMEMEIAVDRELSHGMAPASAYESMEAEIWRMQDELARLQHYESYEDKMYHPRFPLSSMGEFPFQTGPM